MVHTDPLVPTVPVLELYPSGHLTQGTSLYPVEEYFPVTQGQYNAVVLTDP